MTAIAEELIFRIRSRWRRRKTIRQLSALTDQELWDIGLDRRQVRWVAEDMATRRDEPRVRIARSIPAVAGLSE